ncbi:hypothetical protein [Lactobacillus sp. Sy-1]|uniref:hypothetical protein n=1 Tax=Lactobacillus sp. Sy-1 TaxID=2109645 RepID=UPI001C580EF2|nr:hypothetical protein [Lactobacillus sp. Sy-1]MBW1605234.1 hypothetical protein [Lactobacillus sp. Sy-1]
MNHFEGLHPILTANYRLDWLTKFKLPAVTQLRAELNQPSNLEATSRWINETMRRVMGGSELCWGLGDKQGKLMGIITITNLDHDGVDVRIKTMHPFNMQFNESEVRDSIESLLHGISHHINSWQS